MDGQMYSIQHYVMYFVSFQQVGCFLHVLWFSRSIKLLKVALYTTSPTKPINKMDHYNIYCNIVENEVKYPYHCPIVDDNIINNVSIVYLV